MLLLLASGLALAPADVPPDETPKACTSCEAWNAPRAPLRLWGDAWFVGPEGLSTVAVRTSAGVVLLDGALPESVAGITQRLDDLGLTDIRYILTSHAHFDHVGGVAALQRRTGAVVVASVGAEPALRAGRLPEDDPQAGYGAEAMSFPPIVGTIRTVADGEALVVGDTTFTAIATPGHTPGGLSWTWTECEDGRCAQIVYADSLTPASADGFRFTDHPSILEALRASTARIAALPCDVLVPVHPGNSDLFADAARVEHHGQAAMLDPDACVRYARDATRRLDRRLREERRAR